MFDRFPLPSRRRALRRRSRRRARTRARSGRHAHPHHRHRRRPARARPRPCASPIATYRSVRHRRRPSARCRESHAGDLRRSPRARCAIRKSSHSAKSASIITTIFRRAKSSAKSSSSNCKLARDREARSSSTRAKPGTTPCRSCANTGPGRRHHALLHRRSGAGAAKLSTWVSISASAAS